MNRTLTAIAGALCKSHGHEQPDPSGSRPVSGTQGWFDVYGGRRSPAARSRDEERATAAAVLSRKPSRAGDSTDGGAIGKACA